MKSLLSDTIQQFCLSE